MHEPLLRVNIIDARDGLKTDIGKSDFFFPLPENILFGVFFSTQPSGRVYRKIKTVH